MLKAVASTREFCCDDWVRNVPTCHPLIFILFPECCVFGVQRKKMVKICRKQVRKIEIYFCEFNQFASCNHSLLPDPRIHWHLLLTLFCTSPSPFISTLPVIIRPTVWCSLFTPFFLFSLDAFHSLLSSFFLPDSVQYLLPVTHTKTNYGGRRRKKEENKRVRGRAVGRGSRVRRGGSGGLHPEGSLGWIIHLTLRHLRAISLSVSHPLKQQFCCESDLPKRILTPERCVFLRMCVRVCVLPSTVP